MAFWYGIATVILTTMSQDKLVKIKCAETKEVLYTRRNKKNGDKKLELKKYSPKLRKIATFKEMKK